MQSGGDADCAFTDYFFSTRGASGGFLASVQIEGTAWDVEPTTFPTPGFPPNDFFITAGSVKLAGPAVVTAIAAGFIPPACTLIGSTATCPIAVVEAAGLFSPDTGVPAAPGHYSLKNILRMLGFTLPPGSQLNIQVVQVQ